MNFFIIENIIIILFNFYCRRYLSISNMQSDHKKITFTWSHNNWKTNMFNEKIYDDMLERANKLWNRSCQYIDKEDILDFQIERCMCDCFPEYNGCRYCKGNDISIIIGSIDNKDVCCATVHFDNDIVYVDRIFFNGYRILLMADIIRQMYKDNPYKKNSKIKKINLYSNLILDKNTDTDIDWTDTNWITKFKFVKCKGYEEFYKTIKINNNKKDNPDSKMNPKTKQEKKKEKRARRKERRKKERRKQIIK